MDIWRLIQKLICPVPVSLSPEQALRKSLEGITLNDAEKSKLWYELCQLSFQLLGKVTVFRGLITSDAFVSIIQRDYPSLTEIKLADEVFWITTDFGLSKILKRDWTNLVLYVKAISDCDDYAMRLYSHLCDYYKLNSVIPVWGDTDHGYHAFNMAVLEFEGELRARLIDPQKDEIFVSEGVLGHYVPRETAKYLGIFSSEGLFTPRIKIRD